MSAEAFPELDDERSRLTHARACRDAMVARLESVDPSSSADEITSEYIEMQVWEALDSLRSPGAGEFFGRIDEPSADGVDRWYIGRRHIEDDQHDPVVVDWRAPIAAPFYRATAVDPLGVEFRRRFTLSDGELVAYLDERLDDPDGGDVAAGVPDPVLAEIGAARSGAMREIVATIQAEQDIVIRSSIDQMLVVQGGPGTGKTAVALHRAAYLLFEHRARLARDGVLVVGPNDAFLNYIGNVLPSLGERAVRQCTVSDLCIPRVDVTELDDPDAARWKGHPDRLAELAERALAAIVPPSEDVRVPIGARTHVFTVEQIAEWVATSCGGVVPINQRRERLRVLAREELRRRCGGDDRWADAAPLKQAINAAWPTQKPVALIDRYLDDAGFGPRGKRRRWTAADQLLVDEANSLLNGTPFTYGHVIVDEAQDHSAVALGVIGRRTRDGSCTLVGDVAQSTTPAGQERWDDVFQHLAVAGRRAAVAEQAVVHLTIGYRVPEPILEVANRLLPLTGVDARASRSVRLDGTPPAIVQTDDLAPATAAAVQELKHRHRLTGVVAAPELHVEIAEALDAVGLVAVDHLHQLGAGEVPLFSPEAVKGLEFDGVVVVDPGSLLDGTTRGARLLYVALTRAVQEVIAVVSGEVPDVFDV